MSVSASTKDDRRRMEEELRGVNVVCSDDAVVSRFDHNRTDPLVQQASDTKKYPEDTLPKPHIPVGHGAPHPSDTVSLKYVKNVGCLSAPGDDKAVDDGHLSLLSQENKTLKKHPEDRDAELAHKDAELAKLQEEILNLKKREEAQLSNKNESGATPSDPEGSGTRRKYLTKIRKKEEKLAKKEQENKMLQRGLEDREAKLAHKDAELAHKDAELAKQQEKIEELETTNADLMSHFALQDQIKKTAKQRPELQEGQIGVPAAGKSPGRRMKEKGRKKGKR